MSNFSLMLRELVVGIFAAQIGLILYLVWRFAHDQKLKIVRVEPPPIISYLIGASWICLTISGLVGTFSVWERGLVGWDVNVVLLFRLAGVITGLPALVYILRLPPSSVVVNVQEDKTEKGDK